MNFDINTLVSLLFIAGGGGAVAGIINLIKTLRSGKIEKDETLIRRMDSDNKKQQSRAEEAERDASEARAETEEYRKQRNEAREQLARLRWQYIQKTGEDPPRLEE